MSHRDTEHRDSEHTLRARLSEQPFSPDSIAKSSRTRGTTVVESVCPYCAVGCGQLIYVKGSKVIDIEGNPRSPINEGTLCPKGANTFQLAVNPHRITHVMYRAPLAEDPDVKTTPLPVVHWVVWNIPGTVNALREGLEGLDRLEDAVGLRQGPNTAEGNVGYKGPRPPEGDPPHHYYFEVFALDQMLDLGAGANREDLVKAMHGHVLAKGELIGVFKRPEYPAKP
jgi:Raf kinase inhibitor-like YbhB/YbcL family protein